MLSYSKRTLFMAGENPEAESLFPFARGFFWGHRLVFSILCGLLFWFGIVSAVDLHAQETLSPVTVTSVAQLQKLVGSKQRLICSLALTGTVCTANAALGVLAFADNSGAEMFWLNFSGEELKAGQQLTLTATNCEIIRRRTGLAIQAAALLDNDGVHEPVEKSGSVALNAGSHFIQVEWFKQYGMDSLSLQFSGPEIPRQNIPGCYFSHPNSNYLGNPNHLKPGLLLDVYKGSWPRLPDFSVWPATAAGVATNVELGVLAGMTNIGLKFSGMLQVPRGGDYTFYLGSHDGSRLYLGPPEPVLRVFRDGLAPTPSQFFIGEVLQTNTSSWAMLEGHVRFAVSYNGRLELELRSPSNNRLELDVLDDTGLSPELLINSKLRVTGIGRRCNHRRHRGTGGSLWRVKTERRWLAKTMDRAGSGAGPNTTLRVHAHRQHRVISQAIRGGKMDFASPLQTIKSIAQSAGPHRAIPGHRHGRNEVLHGGFVIAADALESSRITDEQSAALQPHINFPTGTRRERRGRAGWQTLPFGYNRHGLWPQLDQPAARGAKPKISFAVFVNGADIIRPAVFPKDHRLKMIVLKTKQTAAACANPDPPVLTFT